MDILIQLVQGLAIFIWDIGLTAINVITPKKKEGHVVPKGHPGFGGKWPEYVAPKPGDRRCPCPAINALANHGIIPHDGKNIRFTELYRAIRDAYNFSPSFVYFVLHVMTDMLGKDYNRDVVDISEFNLHNGIEHDASLTREDTALEPDQGKPHVGIITDLLSFASGRDRRTGETIFTTRDLSRFSSKRRAESRIKNQYFTLDFMHKMFGSAKYVIPFSHLMKRLRAWSHIGSVYLRRRHNAERLRCNSTSTLLAVFGGRVKDIETWLIEERFPEGWETQIRQRVGTTFVQLNFSVLAIEFGINEKRYLEEKKAEAAGYDASHLAAMHQAV